jgi:hypothetical protein
VGQQDYIDGKITRESVFPWHSPVAASTCGIESLRRVGVASNWAAPKRAVSTENPVVFWADEFLLEEVHSWYLKVTGMGPK